MSDLSSAISEPRRFSTLSAGVYMNLAKADELVVLLGEGRWSLTFSPRPHRRWYRSKVA